MDRLSMSTAKHSVKESLKYCLPSVIPWASGCDVMYATLLARCQLDVPPRISPRRGATAHSPCTPPRCSL